MKIEAAKSYIPEFLAKRGKTQVQLAIFLDVSEAFISQIVNRKSFFSVINMKKTAIFLGCNMDDLYEWIISE